MDRLLRLPKHYRWVVQVVSIFVAAIAICSFSIRVIDRPLAEFIQRSARPDLVSAAEALNALSILVPFVLVLVLVQHYLVIGEKKRSRNRILVLVIAAAIAILCVEIVKITFGRVSLSEYFATGAYGFRYINLTRNSDLSSFPSEYGAITASIASSLWRITPSYRSTIILLTIILTGSQLIAGTNFASDMVAGIASGIIAFLAVEHLFCISGNRPSQIE